MNPFPSFSELPEAEQAGMRQFWLEEKARLRQADPVQYFRLQFPDGTDANGEVFEMHLSQATELNSERIFGYLQSAKRREERWAEWEQRVATEKLRRAVEFERLQEQAKQAATRPLALPDTKAGRELLAWRKSHVAEVVPPEAKNIPQPDNSFGPADALWVRTSSDGSSVIRMPNVEVYSHD